MQGQGVDMEQQLKRYRTSINMDTARLRQTVARFGGTDDMPPAEPEPVVQPNWLREKFLDEGIKNAKTANQAKELLESATLKLVELLPDHSDLVFSASFYLPKCIEERARAKKYYKQAFRKIINKGLPGKIDTELERQTELVLFSVYGFYEYCAKVSQKERIAIHKDFTNMINLHLQDRLFF